MKPRLTHLEKAAQAGCCAEDAGSFGMQQAAPRQFVHGGDAGVSRADLQQEIRPEVPGVQLLLDERANAVVGDVDEGTHEGAVVLKDGAVQVEDGHGVAPGFSHCQRMGFHCPAA